MHALISKLVLTMACLLLIAACATPSDPEPPEIFTTTTDQGGQIPEAVARKAATDHGGSMPGVAPGATTTGVQSGGTAAVVQGLTVVLGPVNAEGLDQVVSGTADAGQSIREIISQTLTTGESVVLFDAPEERFIDDSPRPDLARRGVRFVVKGVVSSSAVSKEITVFLRAVNTATGKVAMVASARHASRNQAAVDAADRLRQKLKGSDQ